MRAILALLFLLLLTSPLRAGQRPDILIADFEGEDYGDWKVTGTAFGKGPARGTLPNQMPVTGFLGKGLVNSYHGGDDSTGTLTSPPFTIQRRHINFLIGGGKHPGKTCINLLVDGKVVRTATGPNDRPGGSERLDWHTWNVEDLAGKKVVIEIVDQQKGGWGHINIDHIIQSDRVLQEQPAERELVVKTRYLHLPVKTGNPARRMRLLVEGRTVREFDIELAEGPAFWTFCDLDQFKKKTLKIVVDRLPAESKILQAVTQGDELKGQDKLYQEKHRPQFHFTSRRGWLNDPNGLVFQGGEYHLFYQHNPYGWNWGNMHWGHAVSKDLVHWRELPIALYPRQHGDWCFSGSAVVDRENTAGFQQGREPALVAAFTSTGRGECLVHSNDRGRSWKEFAGNPVVRHQGRDPRLLWHQASRQWVMAVYDEFEGKRYIAFHTSHDLKKWGFQSRIEGFFECPDLFELPIDGDREKKKWVLYAADGKYVLGRFDGKKFAVESGKHQLWHGNFYAAQTFSDTPDDRRIQIGWARGIAFPGMPFNQQMTVPCQLTLRSSGKGVRMFAQPVKELEGLRGLKTGYYDRTVQAGQEKLAEFSAELLDLDASFQVGKAHQFGLVVRGVPVSYDVKKQTITCHTCSARLKAHEGKVQVRVLVDRGSVEVFANDGAAALSVGVVPGAKDRSVQLFSRDGTTSLRSLEVHELRSAWFAGK
jgi:fructan beta-fructosidase